MKRNLPCLIMLLLVIAVSLGLYQISYSSQRKVREVAALKTTLLAEQQRLQVLRAEWAYLSNPARISGIAKQRIGMVAPDMGQIKTPERVAMALPNPVGDLRRLASAQQQPTAKQAENQQLSARQASAQQVAYVNTHVRTALAQAGLKLIDYQQ